MTVSEHTPIRFNLQATLTDRDHWLGLARRAESEGFETLLVPDHPRSTASPFVALAAAASITERIRLGTYVVNAGVWDPLSLATELATLDVVSEGRACFGVGAGHTPSEWTDRGMAYPSAPDRVDRMIEIVGAARRWLDDPGTPAPIQPSIPLLVGGNGRRVLSFAAAQAEIVGVTGLGVTLADGHSHAVEWAADQIDERLAPLRRSERELVVDALVQMVVVTDDRAAAARALADEHDLVADDLLACPYALIGSASEIASDLVAYRERWGITRYTVRPPSMDAVGEIVRALARA